MGSISQLAQGTHSYTVVLVSEAGKLALPRGWVCVCVCALISKKFRDSAAKKNSWLGKTKGSGKQMWKAQLESGLQVIAGNRSRCQAPGSTITESYPSSVVPGSVAPPQRFGWDPIEESRKR